MELECALIGEAIAGRINFGARAHGEFNPLAGELARKHGFNEAWKAG